MQYKIKTLLNNNFFRNVATVAIGTAGAQAITMVFAPFITRLYGPEAFGVMGTFKAFLVVATPLAALSYPLAIVLPKKNVVVAGLVKLSLLISVFTFSFSIMIIYFYGDRLAIWANLSELSPYLYFLPFGMLFSSWLAISNQLAIRENLFKEKSKVGIVQALIVNLSKVAFGYVIPLAGTLVALSTLGIALQSIMLSWGIAKKKRKQGKNEDNRHVSLVRLAKKHGDFAIYRTPQNIINAASQSLPIIMLLSFFGPASAGFYSLSRTVMALPAGLVAQSVGEVFYSRIARAGHKRENQFDIIVKVTIALALVSIIPFVIIFFFGPILFGLVFGSDWAVSGEYARWLSPMLFLNFMNRPAVAAIPVLKLQRGLVLYEIFSTAIKILALYFGFLVFESDMVAIALFGTSGAFAYAFLIAWVLFVARRKELRRQDAE